MLTSEAISLSKKQNTWDVNLDSPIEIPGASIDEHNNYQFAIKVNDCIVVGNGVFVYHRYDLENKAWVHVKDHESPLHGCARNCEFQETLLLCSGFQSSTEVVNASKGTCIEQKIENENSISTSSSSSSTASHSSKLFLSPLHTASIMTFKRNHNDKIVSDNNHKEDLIIGNKNEDRTLSNRNSYNPISVTKIDIYRHHEKNQLSPNYHRKLTKTFCFASSQRIPSPNRLQSCSITRIDDTKVLVVGGVKLQQNKRQGSSRSIVPSNRTSILPSHDTFIGEVNIKPTNIRWTKISGIKKGRYKHMAFKMNENVYVVGGLVVGKTVISTCERYSIPTDKWFESTHKLPMPLYNASVAVTPDELFAILIGGNDQNKKPTNNIIVFDETNGFKLLDQKINRPRSRNISICI